MAIVMSGVYKKNTLANRSASSVLYADAEQNERLRISTRASLTKQMHTLSHTAAYNICVHA